MAERIESEIDLRKSKNDDDPDKKKIIAGPDGEMEDDIEIEIEDDTPEADRNRPERDPNRKSAIPEDEEIGKYTKGVQDRLKQMKWEFHEERRAKEAWERQHGAAVDFAKRIHEENKRLRDLVTKGHKTMLESNKSGAEAEMAALQESLKSALESGETAKAAELQGKLARAAARAEAQNHIAPISFPQEDERDEEDRAEQRPPQRQEVRLSETMQDWMRENPWFNQDKRMTAFAFGVHEELIDKKIPLESPRYFAEINKAVKEAFPNYFEEGDEEDTSRKNERKNGSRSQSQPARRTNVAGVTRTPAGRDGGKVTLTASQVALAKRLGITEQQYAREMIRLENQDV